MTISVNFKSPTPPSKGALALGVFHDNKLSPAAKEWDEKTDKAISRAIKNSKFKGETGQTLRIPSPNGSKLSQIILVGLGKAPTESDFYKVGGAVVKAMSPSTDEEVTLHIDGFNKITPHEAAAYLGAGAKLKSWRFDKYFTKKKPEDLPALKSVTILTDKANKAHGHFEDYDPVIEGTFLTRELVSEPPNILFPDAYAKIAQDLKKVGVKVEVLSEKDMRKLNMGALLGVGQGSEHESKLVVMQWMGAANKKDAPVAFVGKGVTFDSGGISLKPSSGMEEMKFDMAGSAVVVGLMKSLAERKAKVNAIGVIGLVENMPSGAAQKPSDIVNTMSGQTVEVLNTDAEGRLVLADALWYTQDRFKPKFMVDLGTLTMNVILALGYECAGLFSNDEKLSKHLLKAAEDTGERLWSLPMHDYYGEEMKSDVADLRNIGTTRGASSTTAAKFLEKFVNDVPWAHLDIAGTAWASKDWPLCDKGATAFGVRLLDRLVQDNYEEK